MPRRSAATAPRLAPGSAARSAAAGSGGRSAPSLSAALLSGYKRLPEIAAGLLPTPSPCPSADTAAGSAAGPTSPPGPSSAASPQPNAAALAATGQRRERCHRDLINLARLVMDLPTSDGRTAAGVAELLSTHPAETAALLRLLAAGLRANAEVQAASGGGGVGGGGGGGHSINNQNHANAASSIAAMILMTSVPFPASLHALGVLRFARALLATQPFHALARRLAEAAAALAVAADSAPAGPSGGAGPSAAASSAGPAAVAASAAVPAASADTSKELHTFKAHINVFNRSILDYGGVVQRGPNRHGAGVPAMPPGLAAEVAAARAACAEEFARALAESGVVEHAARALLLLQAQPRALRGGDPNPAAGIIATVTAAWRLSAMPASGAGAGPLQPSTTALIRSALGGRCLRTAVLVYGIDTLRVIDRGPSYGVPAALQTAGLALIEPGKGPCPDTAALRLMLGHLSSGTPLPPPGRVASLALILRTGRAAAGSIVGPMPGRTVVDALVGFTPPQRPATPLPKGTAHAVLVEALDSARRLLSATGPSSLWLAEQRREWWWLAGWSVIVASDYVEPEWRRRLWELVTGPLLAVWPDGRLDLDALPPVAPPEVAAALAGGLLPQLARFLNAVALAGSVLCGLVSTTATDLFAACSETRPHGNEAGFTPFLAPLLAYGDPGQVQELLQSLGELAGRKAESGPGLRRSGGVRGTPERQAAARQVAALLRDLSRALRGRGRTEEQGVARASASAAAPESPAQRLERMAA
ncbi:hypothetical protein HYH03_015257 [Edaphochlamys debaryana]|uniref:Uncharacterized protein n=1 Tax=Edaphochlamys debaryana TaxID=47281 RepID=A0A835XSC8_9CHLO|nr:hypothetical protein HYH03_015257 [Edaphochlamys debaryana]|eukprot:KAG2486050.1 hypothetical protein HYH03_015257 [Edaphochlamys debaryana]